ncbi:unnamed protein product [Onchocerca ochengi]|nr:unnamed protein product [Onchocerca ochengi]
MTTTALPQIKNSALTAQPPLTGNTPSPVCSTSMVMFNSGYQPLQQYINLTNQYSQPASTLPSIMNIFEGVPIFLLPQSSSNSSTGALYYNPYQRSITETKANGCLRNQSPKFGTNKNFHVFVGDLAAEVDNCTLKAAFESFGEISEAKVIRDPQTLKSRGYGFVSFSFKEDAEKAIEEMNGQMIGRRPIRTNWAVRKVDGGEENAMKQLTYENIFNATHAANTSIYVGNISSATTDEDLMRLFSTIATVIEVRFFKQQGYAFVRYLSKEAATRAIISMNGKEINGQKIRCSWSRTSTDNNITSNQTIGGMNLLTNNVMGFSPLINPAAWSQNQCLPKFCGYPLLFSQHSYK